MKKVITLIVLFFGLTLSVNAQETKTTDYKVLAQKDVKYLAENVKLSADEEQMFMDLFIYKHKELELIGDSVERKQILADNISKKVLNTLSEDNASLIKNKPEVLKKLSM